MNKCCKGCGVLLQSENPSKIGYVENLDQKYCRRCFRMRNYHEFQRTRKYARESKSKYRLCFLFL